MNGKNNRRPNRPNSNRPNHPSNRVTTRGLFPNINIPKRMQSSSDLWLDCFIQYVETMLINPDSGEMEKVIDRAYFLADKTLSSFEERWPGAKL